MVGPPHNLGDAEVGDLHPALFVQQDVLGLDVAVHDALLVRELQRLANLRHDGQRLLRRDLPRLEQLAQAHAVHELHQQVVEAVGLAEVVHGDDVGVVQPGQRLGFALEALGEAGFGDLLRRQDLQGDDPVELGLAGLVNDAHAAAAEAFEDFELGKVPGDFLQGGRGLEDLGAVRTGGFACAAGRTSDVRSRGQAGF